MNVIIYGVDLEWTVATFSKYLTDDLLRPEDYRYVSLLLGVRNEQEQLNPIQTGLYESSLDEPVPNPLGNLLGNISATPVQENIGWVQAGALRDVSFVDVADNEIQDDFTYDVAGIGSLQSTIPNLVRSGFIGYRKYVGKTGVYFTNGLTLAKSTSDYQPLANVRVINKVVRLLREVYLDFIHSDVQLDNAGDLSDGVVGNLSGVGNNVLFNMRQAGEISEGVVEVPKEQPDLLNPSLQKLDIIVKIIPKAYTAEIVFNVGLTSTLEG